MKTVRTLLNLAFILALIVGLFAQTPAAVAMGGIRRAEWPAERFSKQTPVAALDETHASLPAGLNASEWDSIQAQIQAAEYRFNLQEQDGQEAYRAFNRAQGFDVAFRRRRASALPSRPAGWDFGLTLTAYGGQPVAAASAHSRARPGDCILWCAAQRVVREPARGRRSMG